MSARQITTPLGKVGRFYRWLYYRCYRYDAKASGKFSLHWANAAVYVCLILGMNITVLVLLSVSFFGFWLPTGLPRWLIFVGGVSIPLALGYYVYRGGRYQRILAEFSSETLDERRRGDRLFAWYLVGSLILMVATFALAAIRAGIAGST